MDQSMFKKIREMNRRDFHKIWENAESGRSDDLSEEEKRLGKIMLEPL